MDDCPARAHGTPEKPLGIEPQRDATPPHHARPTATSNHQSSILHHKCPPPGHHPRETGTLENSSAPDPIRSDSMENSSGRDPPRSEPLEHSNAPDPARSEPLENSSARDPARSVSIKYSNRPAPKQTGTLEHSRGADHAAPGGEAGSADLRSAVSPISNRQSVPGPAGVRRLQTCDTADRRSALRLRTADAYEISGLMASVLPPLRPSRPCSSLTHPTDSAPRAPASPSHACKSASLPRPCAPGNPAPSG